MKAGLADLSISMLCLVVTIGTGACQKGDEKDVQLPDDLETEKYAFTDIEKVFGFDGESRYSYCPSVVKMDDGTVHMYFCGTENMVMVDHIYHLRINPDGSKTAPKVVLSPGIGGSWDDHHVCDPSVIGGAFRMDGRDYRYAMFYLTNEYGVYYNEIGVAFSNDLESDHWEKYPHQVVSKTWPYDGDQAIGANKAWGVGQPSAVSLDHRGQVLLTYTIGDIDGTRVVWAKVDFSDLDNYMPVAPTAMVKAGLVNITYSGVDVTNNMDIGIHPTSGNAVIVRPVHPNVDGSYPTKIGNAEEVATIPLTDFYGSTGSWKPIIRINQQATGFPRNHNSGIERNIYGEVDSWEEPTIYYTVSKASPDVAPEGTRHAEWTYHIWRGSVRKVD